MLWPAIGIAILVLIGGFVWWRRRRRNQHRLISFVAMTREPMEFDPAVLARIAGKVWNADLGDGSSEGEDGFVVCAGIVNTIMHEGRMFLINCFTTPYVEDVDAVADTIPDMRIRELLREHKAWWSCDAMGVDGTTSEEDVLDWYQRLGKLFAELLDENCLLIFLPDSGLAFPINDETEDALLSEDPIAALQATLTVPVIEVSADDPLMQAAVKQAREDWPKFVAAFEASAGENFSVKAPVTHGDNTEFIWVSVTSLEGDRVYGKLGNEPANLGPLKLGSKVSVAVADLNDWVYLDRTGNLIGGFTIEAVKQASRRGKK
jgi:uncharacterized protein YegJ (DUF2314 family)